MQGCKIVPSLIFFLPHQGTKSSHLDSVWAGNALGLHLLKTQKGDDSVPRTDYMSRSHLTVKIVWTTPSGLEAFFFENKQGFLLKKLEGRITLIDRQPWDAMWMFRRLLCIKGDLKVWESLRLREKELRLYIWLDGSVISLPIIHADA